MIAAHVYHVFVIAIGAAFLMAAIRRASEPKTKNKFSDLMYTDAERQDETK